MMSRSSSAFGPERRRGPLAITGIVLVCAALVLGIVMRSASLREAEYAVNRALASHASGALDALAKGFNIVFGPAGGVAVFLVLAVIVWLGRRSLVVGGYFLVLAVCGWAASAVLKVVISEPRPAVQGLCPRMVGGSCVWLVSETGNDAYPSGHTAGVTAVVSALVVVTRALVRRIVLIVGAIAVVGVAWSRLYLGVHFLTDTIGGVLVSVGAVLVAIWLCGLVFRNRSRLAR
jgi:undecaprenyl-diphosphatase